jgi:uncharacterized protein (DUF305 family)
MDVMSMKRILAVLGVIVLSLTGCASSGHGHAASSRPSHPASFYRMASPPAYKALDLQFTGRLYLLRSEALQMARQAIKIGYSPAVRQFASGLLSVQQGEMTKLTGWLTQWRVPLPQASKLAEEGSWKLSPSQAEVSDLRALTGAAFDRRFLELVITEQQGALALATVEQEGGGFGPARQLASEIVASSTATIVAMRTMFESEKATR